MDGLSPNTDYRLPIYVDPRVGSKDLAVPLRFYGLPVVDNVMLPFGDVQIPIVQGPNDLPLIVGIERKTIYELVTCIGDSRYTGHQLPGLFRTYPVVVFLVEGRWAADRYGTLVIEVEKGGFVPYHKLTGRPRRVEADTILHFLWTQRLRAGVHVVEAANPAATAEMVRSLYTWGSAKAWASHQSHLGLGIDTLASFRDPLHKSKPSLVTLMLKELPGIGREYAISAGLKWGSMVEAITSSVEGWAELMTANGIKLGMKKAMEVLNARGWIKR